MTVQTPKTITMFLIDNIHPTEVVQTIEVVRFTDKFVYTYDNDKEVRILRDSLAHSIFEDYDSAYRHLLNVANAKKRELTQQLKESKQLISSIKRNRNEVLGAV